MRDREKSKKRLMSKSEDLRKVLDELQDALDVALRVIDAGVGIPEENLKMIYEPFLLQK